MISINKEEYPFESKFFKTNNNKIHFIDEGKGDPIVFVHGNPDWSFSYRNLIKGLKNKYRCIAVDHLGYGLSDKPEHWSYLPKDHALNFEDFMESLDLTNITLVVNDWGGAIGLPYAINHPEKIKNIVIFNTILWSVKEDPYFKKFSGFAGGPIGKFLTRNFNFFAGPMMKNVFGDKSKLSPEIHRHFKMIHKKKSERNGMWIFPREVIGSSDWMQSYWEKREVLLDKRMLIMWGEKDIAFREQELDVWEDNFPEARIVRFPNAGHLPHEEEPGKVLDEVINFLN